MWSASTAYDCKVVAKSSGVIDGIVLASLSSPFIADDGTVLCVGNDASGATSAALFAKHFKSQKGTVLIKQGDYINGYGFSQDQTQSASRMIAAKSSS